MNSPQGRSVRLWWALNIVLVVLVFLAFVLSAASVAKDHQIANQITNNVANNQVGRILPTVKVGKGHHVRKGYVVSYTDNANEVGGGLGPEWGEPVFVNEGFSTAYVSSLNSFNARATAFAFATIREPDVLRIRIVLTDDTSPRLGSGAFLRQEANFSIEEAYVRTLDDVTFALVYTTFHNRSGFQTWLTTGQTAANYSSVQLNQPVLLTAIEPSWRTTVYTQSWRDETNSANAFLGILYGREEREGSGCSFIYYRLERTLPFFLRQITPTGGFNFRCAPPFGGHYLQNGYFALVNQFDIALAKIDFNAQTIVPFSQASLGDHRFQGEISLAFVPQQNLIILAGSQNDLQGPTAMTQVVYWRTTAAPYLTVFTPSSLLPTTQLTLYRNHIRTCYIAPSEHQPAGVLLYTYVDARSGLTMLVRGKIELINARAWVLPSPHIIVSSIPYYGAFTSNLTVGPHLICPSAGPRAFLVVQNEPPMINSFSWHGGYRLAGIAESEATEGQTVQVVRVGTGNSPYPLQAGFSYYANNSGLIHSTVSVNQQFAPFGWPYRLGVALSDSQLLLDFEVIDRINNAFW